VVYGIIHAMFNRKSMPSVLVLSWAVLSVMFLLKMLLDPNPIYRIILGCGLFAIVATLAIGVTAQRIGERLSKKR
jgi:hypothetical protein